MNISFMTFSCPDWDLDTIIAKAKEYGYGGFEPRVAAGHKHGIELSLSKMERSEIKKKVRDSGIDISCLATSARYSSPDEEEYRRNIDDCRNNIALASDLGVKLIRVFGGRLPEPKEGNRERFYDRIACGLRECGLFADQHGVTLCLETHDDFCRVKNAVEVIARADAPGLSINWDFTHSLLSGDDPGGAYRLACDKITHLHARDCKYKGNGKPLPAPEAEFLPEGMYDDWELVGLGEGDMPVREVMQLMVTDGFDGFFSLEWGNWTPEVGLPRDAVNFHRIMGELSESKKG